MADKPTRTSKPTSGDEPRERDDPDHKDAGQLQAEQANAAQAEREASESD